MPVDARRLIRKMRGGAQAHLMEASDGHCYVVKFLNNPQHRRILVNEWISSVFLRYLGIATPEAAMVNLPPEFLAANAEVSIQLGSRRQEVSPGWHFGSRFPGDPARMIAGDRASAETLENVRRNLGLDRPVVEQFTIYISNLLQGDLGTSLRTNRPVAGDIRTFLPATLELGVVALFIAICLGVPLGVLSAVYKDGPIDQVARTVSVCGISMPVFWFGLIRLRHSVFDIVPKL